MSTAGDGQSLAAALECIETFIEAIEPGELVGRERQWRARTAPTGVALIEAEDLGGRVAVRVEGAYDQQRYEAERNRWAARKDELRQLLARVRAAVDAGDAGRSAREALLLGQELAATSHEMQMTGWLGEAADRALGVAYTRRRAGRNSATRRTLRADARRDAIRALLRDSKRAPTAAELARRLEADGHVNAAGKRWSERTIRVDLEAIDDQNPASS